MIVDSLYATRAEIEAEMFREMAKVLTTDAYQRGKEYISNLNDEEFQQFRLEAAIASARSNTIKNYRDYLNTSVKIWNQFGISNENTALNSVPPLFLSEESSCELWNMISSRKPQDVIRLSHEEDKQIMSLWKSGKSGNPHGIIPADIFFRGTIPLKDCRFEIDETDLPNGYIVRYRVVIFDYDEELNHADFDTPVLVGAVVASIGPGHLFMPLTVVRGVDYLLCSGIGFHGFPQKFKDDYGKNVSQQEVLSGFGALLETWYGVQIALLHPTIKSVFRSSRLPDETRNTGTYRPGKRKVKYVKVHIINKDDLENFMYGGKKTINRHALVWYVIGHWRVYESGKKVFIKPYWKGALRDLKSAAETREREIITGGTDNA